MSRNQNKLTLDLLATYQIKVPGELDQSWADWSSNMQIKVETGETGRPVTVFTTMVDQAALQGLLRRLYAVGLPLISVTYIGDT
ncbi:MAG: hypothetical protein ACK2UM_06485 [Anaerolineales bacterium]|jgi:hypothetical protein